MVNKELLDYIKSVRAQGHKDEDVKSHLIKHGYNAEIVDDAFRQVNSSDRLANVSEKKTFSDTGNKGLKAKKVGQPVILILIIIGSVLLGLAVFFGINFFLNSSSESCEGASIGIYELNENPVLCVFPDNSIVQLMIENKGSEVINSVDIEVLGKSGMFVDSLSNLNLQIESSGERFFTRVVQYDNAKGDVLEVSLVPYVIESGQKVKCIDKKFSMKDIRKC